MATLEQLGKLYDSILNDKELTTSLLNEIGFNQDELKELIEGKIIIEKQVGIYAFIDATKLYYYGKNLLLKSMIPEAIKVFRQCYKIDPKHVKACFQLFLSSVKKGRYDESLEYFEVLFVNGNDFRKTDSNLFLYLLNLVIDIPEKYKKYLLTLNFEDFEIKSGDERVKNLELENTIRKDIFENKFHEALEKLIDGANFNELLPLQRAIVVSLLRQIIKNKEESAKVVVSGKISKEDETEKKLRWLKSFMFDQRKHFIKRGISFLHEEDSKKVMCIADLMIKHYPQIEMIFINDGYNCQCVLRCFDASENMAEVKDLMGLANQNFNLENFSEAKKTYLKLLRFETVDPIVYERLGIIYSIKPLTERTPIAFKFLDLAKHFYQKNGLLEKAQELSNLIIGLRDNSESDNCDESYDFDRKPDCKAIDIQKITDYMIATGLDINTVCEDFKLTGEEIGLVMLTYAKEYYSQGDFSYGEALMKTFERWPNKNPYTKSLFKEVSKNKDFYPNGRNPETPRLMLGIKFKQSKESK